jgi:hypothetical protein
MSVRNKTSKLNSSTAHVSAAPSTKRENRSAGMSNQSRCTHCDSVFSGRGWNEGRVSSSRIAGRTALEKSNSAASSPTTRCASARTGSYVHKHNTSLSQRIRPGDAPPRLEPQSRIWQVQLDMNWLIGLQLREHLHRHASLADIAEDSAVHGIQFDMGQSSHLPPIKGAPISQKPLHRGR